MNEHLRTRPVATSLLLAALALGGASARASTGVCDSNPPVSTQACIDAIQAGGTVLNEVFTDVNGLSAQNLPVFGKLFNNWPGCDTAALAGGCFGQSLPPYDCPGQYSCAALPNAFATAGTYLNALDRLWAQPCRLANHSLVNGCPQFGACVGDGTPGNYYPWEGLVFDLGGPANKVAIFAQNDHGPQPCESTEYTVYLTDNPFAQELITSPATSGVDPMRWNRAVLSKVFTKGWTEVRPPDPAGHASCGDTALYSVEEDSFAQVYSLPCGITFRYASILAGNDGLDFPACGFDSNEAELDAVAGLSETGAGVCPDNDGDLFVDCNCPGAPPICDCDDGDPGKHPGALEACDAPDLNCDGLPGGCADGLTCYDSLCVPPCTGGENPFCPAGSTCLSTELGQLCVPDDCSGGNCPPGGICSDGVCVPICDDVVCPGTQICRDGQCVDPCAAIECPAGQSCQGGVCVSPCSCFAGDMGCVGQAGTECDPATGVCVPPLCKGVTCSAGESCDPLTGLCVGLCNDGVQCPPGQKCVDPGGCVPLCNDIACEGGLTCDPATGQCVDLSCVGVSCFEPTVCVDGVCVAPPAGSGGAGGAGAGGSGGAAAGGAGGVPSKDVFASGEDDGGCGCRVAGGERASDAGYFAALALASALARAGRRRARRPSKS